MPLIVTIPVMKQKYFFLLLSQDAQCCGHVGSSRPCNCIANDNTQQQVKEQQRQH